jgi:peptidyl-prolyl cis-trans isomerase C
LVIVLFGACAQRENKPLAKVGKEVITVGQMEKLLPKNFSTQDQFNQHKDRQLQNMINHKLFVAEAKALGFDKNQQVVDQYELRKKDVFLRNLYERVVIDRATASAADIKSGYKLMGEEVWLKLILLDTKEEADKVLAELRTGVPFETLAVKYSRHGSAARGGDMGFGSLFDLETQLKRPVTALRPNQTTAAIKITGGFAILKLIECRKKQLGDFKKESPRIKAAVLQQKQNELAQKFMEGITARITYNPHGLDLLTKNLDSLTQSDLEIWVAKKSSQYIKVANLIPLVKRMPDYLTPPLKIYGIKRELESDLLLEEAQRRRLDQDKKVKEDLERLLDDILYSTLYQAEIAAQSQPSDSEIGAYYTDHKQDYPDKKLDDVKDTIKNRLEMQKRTTRFAEYIQELKAKYPVTTDTLLLASIKRTVTTKEKK